MNLRLATPADVPTLNRLIAASGLALSRGFYRDDEAAAITRQVLGVDSQLIADGTCFAIEADDVIVATGGWSRRGTLFGSDRAKGAAQARDAHGSGDEHAPDPLLDPAVDAARIRAFFVAPTHARQGLGTRLMRHCAAEAWAAGFRRLTLVATMPGVPLYLRFGFTVDDRFALPLDGGHAVALATMSRPLPRPELERV